MAASLAYATAGSVGAVAPGFEQRQAIADTAGVCDLSGIPVGPSHLRPETGGDIDASKIQMFHNGVWPSITYGRRSRWPVIDTNFPGLPRCR